jgi:hypothetical protein
VTHLPIERLWPFYLSRNLLIDSTIGFHVIFLCGFAPTGIPKKRKGIQSTSQWRKTEVAHKKFSSRLMPYNLLLKKMTFNPNTSSKLRRTIFRVHKFSQFSSPTMTVTSANWRVLNCNSLLTLNQWNCLCELPSS